ncbi:MAG TPA: apolipoprotein N-acyltransferase [Actinomycetes bacterium]|nr:apolipoprotein N-acyltransferase [Actinomycetes bacterium]
MSGAAGGRSGQRWGARAERRWGGRSGHRWSVPAERHWGARAGAVLLGAPLALAFPRPSLWWLAFVGLVPLLTLIRAAPTGRDAAVLAWLGGAGFFVAVDAFLLPKVGPFAVPAALLLGTCWAPWGLIAWALLHREPSAARVLAALAVVPSAFVAGEYVRAWPGLGGPWGLLGASQWNDLPVLALASVGGVWAVSFLLAAVNVAVAVALAPRASRPGLVPAVPAQAGPGRLRVQPAVPTRAGSGGHAPDPAVPAGLGGRQPARMSAAEPGPAGRWPGRVGTAGLGPGPGGQRPGRVVAAVALVGLVAGTLGYAALRPASAPSGTVRVAVVQPGVVHQVEPRFRASEAATLALAPTRPDLVVWGESSVGRDPATHPGDLARLTAAARATGARVLVNVDAEQATGAPGTPAPAATAPAQSGSSALPRASALSGAGQGGRRAAGIYKTSLLVGPNGPEGSYDKMRLVPFGEYIPLRRLFGWVTRFTDAAALDRRHGSRLVVLDAGPVAVGPLVCFESAFPDLARSLAGQGADLVVVQSATTTFQQSWGPDQHASLAAVRAVESGRPVLQAAISGVSAAFDARGRRLAWHPTTWRGADVIAVPLSRERTPYVRLGDWLPAGSCVLTLVALAWVARRRRPPGHRGGPDQPDPAADRPSRRALAPSPASPSGAPPRAPLA